VRAAENVSRRQRHVEAVERGSHADKAAEGANNSELECTFMAQPSMTPPNTSSAPSNA
jgi:hypothetical protein